jgi:hypothetical protein
MTSMTDAPDQEIYISEAVQGAAGTLLWQASDATEDGNGFPISEDDDSVLHGETQFVDRVIEEVPYLTEAVTAFVRDNWALLLRGGVTGAQCGHDIILTANHHGAGFWDRGLDMPATDDMAYAAWQGTQRFPYPRSRALWTAWLALYRPYPAQYPQSVGDALTDATRGYSFDAEFALDEDDNVTWLMVENTVLVNVPCPECGGTLTADITGHKLGCRRDLEDDRAGTVFGDYLDERERDEQ